jgi:general secretion pathway protein F
MMPRYSYKAYGPNGALETGEIAAASRGTALEALAHRGQVPVELSESGTAVPLRWWQREVFAPGRLSATQLSIFTRELASLAKAELPIDDALRIVAAQPSIPLRLRQINADLVERVREGQSLSEALAAQGGAFPDFYWRLIKAGEASGAMGAVLDDLAVLLERSAEVRAQTASSLVYPAILVVAALAAVGVITGVLLPAIMPIFEDAKATPPFLMTMLAAAHDALARNWVLVLALLGSLAAALIAAFNNEPARLAIDRALLRVPVIGRFIRDRETARFARTLSALVRNGVPVLDSVRIAGGVLSNRVFVETVRAAGEEIREGGVLSRPLARSGLFPDLFLRLAVVGEETGHLDAMHLRAAEIYEASQQRQLQRLTALITPVLTLVIGVVVGGLILSVMGAILSINELAVQ